MNRYDQFFDFRMASWDDIDAIMQFIKTYWDSDHILANDRNFFEYHYGNPDAGINVFLMCNKLGKIVGILGFVQYSERNRTRYISTSVTKVVDRLPMPMCGIELMKRFREYIYPFVEFSCGANPKTIVPIFEKVFKYKAGVMSQYYMVNSHRELFDIITIPDRYGVSQIDALNSRYKLKKICDFKNTTFDFDKEYDNLPIKDRAFLEKRYFCHPTYQYTVYTIGDDSQDRGLLFTRKVQYKNSSIILIVDFMGELRCFGLIGKELMRILIEEDAECISLLEAGIPDNILRQSGFHKVSPGQTDVIIPTYFEPFANCNITNYYVTMKEDMVIFKATGDQDNPKYLPR